MPFALVKGGSDNPAANSYADRADYLATFGDQGVDGADLTAIAAATLERHLVSATRFLEQLDWHGEPKFTDHVQRLSLPRFSLVVGPGSPHYREGDTLPDNAVPWVVIRAVCLLAEEERMTGKTLWRPVQQRRDVLKQKTSIVGSQKVWDDPQAARSYPVAMSLLEGLHRQSLATPAMVVAI